MEIDHHRGIKFGEHLIIQPALMLELITKVCGIEEERLNASHTVCGIVDTISLRYHTGVQQFLPYFVETP
jgi:hypothetical protein